MTVSGRPPVERRSISEIEAEITRWLVRVGLEAADEAEVVDGLCVRLAAGGIPLWRVATGAELLHPLLDARGCRWLRGQGIIKEDYSRAAANCATTRNG